MNMDISTFQNFADVELLNDDSTFQLVQEDLNAANSNKSDPLSQSEERAMNDAASTTVIDDSIIDFEAYGTHEMESAGRTDEHSEHGKDDNMDSEPDDPQPIDDDEDDGDTDICHIKSVKTNKGRLAVRGQAASVSASATASSAGRQQPSGAKPMKVCEICGNEYKFQHALDGHMRRHRNEKPFKCP